MDLKQIEKLMAAMERMHIKRVALKQEGFEIEIERGGGESSVSYQPPHPHPVAVHAPFPTPLVPSKAAGAAKDHPAVTSPMVGTFYSAPSPEDAPFVKVGDTIEPDQVVCIIEAMKVMNEVKAGLKGKVVEILVKNGEPVEFGTPIFRVEPT